MQKVEWGEFKIEDVLQWQTQKEIDPLKLKELTDKTQMVYPFYGQATVNNGIISYNQLTKKVLNNEKGKSTILIHSNNQNIVYVETPFYLKDGHGATSVLQSEKLNKINQLFIIASIDKVIKSKYSYNNKATKIELKNTIINLPIKNGAIDFDFMENFVADLEKAHIDKLDIERITTLNAYLKVTDLKSYILTDEEQKAVELFNSGKLKWANYNVESLFGKSTRGKRLKSRDRIIGKLPFVTAGEINEGISAYVGNDIDVFSKNTSTIDMFGSAKYRNYDYGGDDHVAVVHTEKLPKYSSIFITTALNKASCTGQFDYSRNFYAKDADNLSISLPTKNDKPDFDFMATYIEAIQKHIIQELNNMKNDIINVTKSITQK